MKLLKIMKQYMVILPFSAMTLFVGLPQGASAQLAIAAVIKAGVKRVVKAVDLKVQRLQNKTIWLQNAQKVLENQLSKLKLDEIAEWTGKQRELYEKYYNELWEIKAQIAYYRRIKELTEKQVALVKGYRQAWDLLRKDTHFSIEELEEMQKVYRGILDASVKHVDEMLMVVNSFKVQMSDAARLDIINRAADGIEVTYNDLMRYNTQNAMLSIQRSADSEEVDRLKRLYGIGK